MKPSPMMNGIETMGLFGGGKHGEKKAAGAPTSENQLDLKPTI